MQKTIYYLLVALFMGLLSSCNDVNLGNLFYSSFNVDQRFASSMQYNAEHSAIYQEVTEDYSFILCSDLHIQQEDNPYIEAFFNAKIQQEAQFVVYNGDLFHGQEAEAQKAHQLLQAKNTLPYYCLAGNHDLYFGWDLYHRYFGSSTYAITIATPTATDLMLVLESASGTLGKDQLAWLKQQLNEERGKHRHCFVVTHTNFTHLHATNGIFMDDERHVLFRLFADHRVTAVISGHAHKEHQITYLGVPYYTTNALKNGAYGQLKVTEKVCTWEFKQL